MSINSHLNNNNIVSRKKQVTDSSHDLSLCDDNSDEEALENILDSGGKDKPNRKGLQKKVKKQVKALYKKIPRDDKLQMIWGTSIPYQQF